MWYQERKGHNGKYIRYTWTERYKDPRTGLWKTVSVTLDGYTRKYEGEARRILDRKIEQKLKAVLKTVDDMTFGELCDRYIEWQQATNKPGTVVSTQYALKTLRDIIGDDTVITTLQAEQLRDLIIQHDPSNTTRNQRIKCLNKTLRYGYDRGLLNPSVEWGQRNSFPIRKLKEPTPAVKNADKYLTPEQIHTLVADMSIPKWRCLSVLLASTGMRVGEAISLSLRAIDFENRTITISRTWSLSAGVMHDTPKEDNSYRRIYINDRLASTLRMIIAYEKAYQASHEYQSELLFSDVAVRGGGYHVVSYAAYAKYFREHVEKLFPERTVMRDGRKMQNSPYILRHSFCCEARARGIPEDTIARVLGHSVQVNRTHYSHVTDQISRNDREYLEEFNILTY